MDDLLGEFLTETAENLDVVDVELVKFERDPNNADILGNIFRLVHTIKGTCGFLDLPRLESLAHAAETLMGKYREGAPVTPEGVSLILATIDRLKEILAELEQTGAEPEATNEDLVSQLEAMSAREEAAVRPEEATVPAPEPAAAAGAPPASEGASPEESAADMPAAAELQEGSVKNQSIRVNVETLEHLMTMVSELVLTRNQLLEMVRRLDESEFKAPLQRLSNVTAELQEGVMKTRMQPIGNAWAKLPRIIRDLSRDLGKKIDLRMEGAETELDRQVLELIKDPLTHMVRNSADHGLEETEDRRRLGKPETGAISLKAYHEGGHIIIEVADDGRGLDAARIRAKALEKGLATKAELDKMSDAQVHKFIFLPGFSTAARITSVSGRGVGMDVVRANIELIGGAIDVRSALGRGSTFIIKIPLTLAIVSVLIVEARGQRFAIPQLSVIELVRISDSAEHRIEKINDAPVLRLRNKLLPLIRLSDLLKLEIAGEERQRRDGDRNLFVVVIQVGSQLFGFVVNHVFDTEEIVVKPMSAMLRDIPLFSGNTILGDGSVIMIIDPNGIADSVSTAVSQPVLEHKAEDTAGDLSEERTALLLFKAGSSDQKAVPLALVTRLEEIDVNAIEHSNGQDVVQYRGALMPLVSVEGAAERRQEGAQPILVFSDDRRSVGLSVDEIVDIVEERLDIQIAANAKGVIGSAVVKGKATEILDIGHYIEKAFADWGGEQNGQAARGLRLLLVDDSAFFRNMLAPLLSSIGYKVTLAESAAQALALKEAGAAFDVIVSDIEMPEMDGIAFAEALRHDPKWRSIPVIALSSHDAEDVLDRARRAGFVNFVGKFDRQGLVETLRECRSHAGAAA